MARVRSVMRLSIVAGLTGQRGRISVGEHRQGLVRQDGVIRGDEREGRADDLVARIDAHDVQGGDQRGGAARRGQAALRA